MCKNRAKHCWVGELLVLVVVSYHTLRAFYDVRYTKKVTCFPKRIDYTFVLGGPMWPSGMRARLAIQGNMVKARIYSWDLRVPLS